MTNEETDTPIQVEALGKKTAKKLDLNKSLPGFRPGMTKERILESLTDDDWKRIDQMKELQDRKLTNDWAYKLLIESEQSKNAFNNLKREARKHLSHILALKQTINQNKQSIIANDVSLAVSNDVTTIRDVEIENIGLDMNLQSLLALLRTALAKIYTYVGVKDLADVVMMTEEQYNAFVEEIHAELDKDNISLL